eukprot:TRINITY_DN5753_c0_g3_i1.p1 TRINITY_DN5753_c0_g3~~TRINITY_DN5753_c0_g3_i1.p1  ORF type:complete len:176 (-),score=25.95 TRINITY_DN5753_c0_g3_i1:174-701(-)
MALRTLESSFAIPSAGTFECRQSSPCSAVFLSSNRPANGNDLRMSPTLSSVRMAGLPSSPPGTGSGSGLLDKPVIERPSPGRESEFDLKKKKKMSPPYRVMLHNDNFNRREYVVQVLMKVIPGMTVDNAVNIMQEAHVNGVSVVIICAQEDAEEHCMGLRNNGLLSSIEPAINGC